MKATKERNIRTVENTSNKKGLFNSANTNTTTNLAISKKVNSSLSTARHNEIIRLN